MSSDILLLPMDSLFPVPGRLVVLQQEVAYRWLPYHAKSPQGRAGIAGRWQACIGGRWFNAQPTGLGWRHPLDGEFPGISAEE